MLPHQPNHSMLLEKLTYKDVTQTNLTTIGSLIVKLELQFTTKDNAVHAGPSLPLKPLNLISSLLEINLPLYPWNKLFLAILQEKTKDVEDDSQLELIPTLKVQEELKTTMITHTMLKVEKLDLATSTLEISSPPSPTTTQLTEKLDYTNKCLLPQEDQFQSVLMPLHGKTMKVEFYLPVEMMLITASKQLDMPTTEKVVLIGS